MLRPNRICTLCPNKIRMKERLCPSCKEQWKDELTSDWMRGIISEGEYQHNVQLRDFGRTIPLEKVRTI